ncbi:LysE family translocator [Balneatrix alpica]|uniref:LysE family translocator n=1 Tax=Balneatrix alpica TaxID=75684 RepID=UPI0027389E7A|nr:LysE family translocator [Balneatrix alpica]
MFGAELVLIPFVFACLAIYLAPGPDMLLLVSTGLSQGIRPALYTALGTACSRSLHVLFAAFGMATLINSHPLALDAVRLIGASYLLWMAWQAIRQQRLAKATDGLQVVAKSHFASYFKRGFYTNLLNPKALLFCSLFLPQFIGASSHPLQAILQLGVIFVLIGLSLDGVYAWLAGYGGQWWRKRQQQGSGLVNYLQAGVFGLLASHLLLATG